MNELNVPVAQEEIVYQFERLVSLTGWWTWAGVVVGICAAIFLVTRLYRRDTVELPRATGLSLLFLRLTAIVALVFFFLSFERRTQQRITRSSEVVALIDTSQSMSLPSDRANGSASRISAVSDLFANTPMLDTLSSEHRVVVYGFDEMPDVRELASFRSPGSTNAEPVVENHPSFNWSRIALVGLSIFAFGVISLLVSGLVPLIGWRWASSLILASSITLVIGGILVGAAWTVNSSASLVQLWGFRSSVELEPQESSGEEAIEDETEVKDWEKLLVASGTSSRIGDAVRSVLNRHDPSTLAGILLLTDGQSNAGIPIEDAGVFASRDGVSVFPIGFGSAQPPVNARIVDVDLPRRVYPGDRFALSVVVQASGLKGESLDVEILEGPEGEATLTEVIETRKILLGDDGKLYAHRIELEPPSIGPRRILVRLRTPRNDQHVEDDSQEARYEVVARKVKVLMLAGGPTREFRFVRNLLHRDRDVSVDVLLQTGQEGMSQDSNQVLLKFPSTPEELFEYDAIIAFDPDWLQLEAAQIQLIDRWLSDLSGGLILVSGPVHLPEWSRLSGDLRVGAIKGFFPVNIANRGPIIDTGRQGGITPWSLKFSPDGQRTEFLSLTDSPADSAAVWQEFGGVFDFVGVKDPKPGAKVLAYFSDPTTSVDGRLPIYLASQFYGSGRVFFQGSGEMWRLRAVSDSYFQTYYTKLVRWATEGRLLRDSTRGVLIVDKPRAMVGESITIRAKLTDAQYRPLTNARVVAELVSTSGERSEIVLRPLEGQPRPGTYGGQFVAKTSGSFELQLMLGDSLDGQLLRQPVQVLLPTLELERPQRNDTQLKALAAVTDGQFAAGSGDQQEVSKQKTPIDLVASIEPRPQTTVLPGTPDRDFQRRRNASLLWLIAGALTLEWLLRRLNRLA